MNDNNSLKKNGVSLEKLNWQEAALWLQEDPVVVIPLGAAAKEHGPHLPLNTDAITANWLAEQVLVQLPVVIAPIVNVSFYPAFIEYPGSISLKAETAGNVLVDICSSLASFGARRFYVINNGVSTEKPLSIAKQQLANEIINLEYLELGKVFDELPESIFHQIWGSHADEHETSLLLHIAPEVVDMSKAIDDGSEGQGGLIREPGKGIYSPSGVYGQATLANAEKGKIIAQRLLDTIVEDITALMG